MPGSGSFTLLTVLIVVAVLYFARGVLIPLALAVLFAFLLGPIVVRFRSWGLGAIPSAVVVVLVSLAISGWIGAVMLGQLGDLAKRLPGYQQNMQHKLDSIRESGGGFVHKMSLFVYQLNEHLKPPPAEAVGAPQTEKPVPVEIRRPAFSPVELVQKVIGSVLETMVTAAIVVVFVLFMLIQRQDLRDRILRLAGAGRINLATTVLDDAARRVSRYLLAQLLLNSIYGVIAGVGLFFIGVPNPILWGFLTALLRYVPYLGIWIAAILPATLAFAVDPGWTRLFLIAGLYFGTDMLMYNFFEPMLYGGSTGLSPIAILVAAVFWTWLWGPVGLLLSTPLTVCVVVIGRHVPRLEFLSIMLSDDKPLTDDTRFYQRMLAMDDKEASEIARKAMAGKSLEYVYDHVLVPALVLAEKERHKEGREQSHIEFVTKNTRRLVDELALQADELVHAAKDKKERPPSAPNTVQPAPAQSSVMCIPARSKVDEVAAAMLANLLNKQGVHTEQLSAEALAGEAAQLLEKNNAQVVCVCSVPPFGYRQVRYLCQKLRADLPGLRIVAAIFTEQDVGALREQQPALEADELATSLQQAAALSASLASVEQPSSEQAKAA